MENLIGKIIWVPIWVLCLIVFIPFVLIGNLINIIKGI